MAQLATDHATSKERRILPDDIVQATEAFFGSMLGVEVEVTEAPESPPAENRLQASVRIDGGWNAELRTIASQTLAESIARTMFCNEAGDLAEGEVHDAFGEVANVIGGNLKGIVNQNSTLSIPELCESNEEVPADSLRLVFRCFDESLHIVLIEK